MKIGGLHQTLPSSFAHPRGVRLELLLGQRLAHGVSLRLELGVRAGGGELLEAPLHHCEPLVVVAQKGGDVRLDAGAGAGAKLNTLLKLSARQVNVWAAARWA